jgi:hypothetical protein
VDSARLVCPACRLSPADCKCSPVRPWFGTVCSCGRYLVAADPSDRNPADLVGAPARVREVVDSDGSLQRCDEAGCDFSTDDAGALALHELEAHDWEAMKAPPLLAAMPAPAYCGACGFAGPDAMLGALGWARVTLSARGGNVSEGLHLVVFVALHRSPGCNSERGVREALAKLSVGVVTESLEVRSELPVMERPTVEVPRG